MRNTAAETAEAGKGLLPARWQCRRNEEKKNVLQMPSVTHTVLWTHSNRHKISGQQVEK